MTMTMTIPCICPFCGHQTDITCTYEQYREYTLNPRALVQDVFADKDVHTRETIVSGMCKDCQDRFFTEDEEEEEEEDPYEGCFECDNTECPLAK